MAKTSNAQPSFDVLTAAVSVERLHKYRQVTNFDDENAAELYDLQVTFSSLFAGFTHYYELILRNKINEYMCRIYGNDWLIVLSMPGSAFDKESTAFTFAELARARELLEKRELLTNSKMLDELMFGFWTGLLQTKQYRALNTNLLSIFGLTESRTNLNKMHWRADQVRKMRNSIAHHRAIIFDQTGNVSFDQVDKCLDNILRTTTQLGVSTSVYDAQLQQLIKQRNKIEKLLGIDNKNSDLCMQVGR